ncbi:MAG: hypothetical protein OXF84_13180 [Bacteroidetes bacterium]|nr:hypothetical protein [Bacteroidota bacterium]
MKILPFVFVLLALLIPACDSLQQQDQELFCSKQTALIDLPFVGEVSALRNNQTWNESLGGLFRELNYYNPTRIIARTADNESETMTISMLVTASDGGPYGRQETLRFPSIPKRLGTYPLNEFSVQATKLFAHIHGYDVGSGYVYNLEPSEGGFITVDSYDPGLCTIQGTFAMTLIRNPVDSEEYHCPPCDYLRVYVDTLRITDGKFHTQIVTR